MTNINIDNCNITESQLGSNNYMNISHFVSDDDWKELESFFDEKLKKVEKEYGFLVKEAENYVKEKDEKGLKNFINRHASEFVEGVLCNVTSASIVNLLQKFGIWV